MEPMVTASDLMWQDFQRQKGLDTVYVGSSFCRNAFNPYVIDSAAGTESFNMGTDSQTIDETLIAVREALRTYHVKTVVYGVGLYNFDALTNKNVNAKVGFRRALEKSTNWLEALHSKFEFITSQDEFSDSLSVNYFFPWLFDHISFNDPDAYEDNIEYKLSGKTVLEIAAEKEKFREYRGKGFLSKETVIDYDNITETGIDLYDNKPDPATMKKMKRLCALCSQYGAQLIVVATPKTAVDITSYGKAYWEESSKLEKFFTANGAIYYDFNMAKPSFYAPKSDDYEDFEHLNEKGSAVFSKAFAEILQQGEGKNEEVSEDLFWHDWDSYIASLKSEGTLIYGGKTKDGKVICISSR